MCTTIKKTKKRNQVIKQLQRRNQQIILNPAF